MRDRLGPRRPPCPSIAWQYRQPFAWNIRAPSAIGPVVAPTTEAVSGGATKFGDHADLLPATQSELIITTALMTITMDHGRRDGLRSPLFATSGGKKSTAPMITGPIRMT